MKKAIFIASFILSLCSNGFSQGKPVKFTVSVSTDSVLMDNYFEVKFVLENADGQNFEAPDFGDHFNVMSGPNFSSSMSMVNGDVTQSMTITYYLEPKDVGAYYILPASVDAGGKILETSPLEVLVVPNPDGIKQSPPSRGNNNLQFNFGNPFDFDFSFPDMRDMPQQKQPAPRQEAPVEQKKKRKTTRI